jgi:hypothetical protein
MCLKRERRSICPWEEGRSHSFSYGVLRRVNYPHIIVTTNHLTKPTIQHVPIDDNNMSVWEMLEEYTSRDNAFETMASSTVKGRLRPG